MSFRAPTYVAYAITAAGLLQAAVMPAVLPAVAIAAPLQAHTAEPGVSTSAVPAPRPANRPLPSTAVPRQGMEPPAAAAKSRVQRAALASAVKTWGIQLQELEVASARLSSFDLLVADATGGAKGGQPLSADDVAALKTKPDGSRRLAISYLSIGEAEDYRPDYFTAEYMTEDAPDWLLSENERWKGNRRISFCEEGWQRTILGDDDGRNVYNSVEPSPLYKLIELGFDGVYLDRVDVYSEVQKQCPDAARKMVQFVARLAAHARKKKPDFIVILQNAEELLQNPDMVATIDAVAKEDLFYGADHTERANDPAMVDAILKNLALAHKAGRPVFVLDYLKDPAKRSSDRTRAVAQGFLPYIGPRKLNELWPQEAGH